MTEVVEADVLRKLKRFMKDNKLRYVRLTFRQGVGTSMPDLLILIPGGRPLLLEVKRPGAVLEPKQEHTLVQLKALGYDVDWCDNSSCGIEIIKAALKRADARRA